MIWKFGERYNFLRQELWKGSREIQTAIRRLALEQCLAQVDCGRLAVGALEEKRHGN
jgi:hypothetical protein